MGEHYECSHCGWTWPLPTEPPDSAECDNCGDDEFVRWVDQPERRR